MVYLDNTDNALQIYLDNDSYRDKIITHIFWIFVISKLLCVLTYLYVVCSIQYSILKFTIIKIATFTIVFDQ